MSVQDFLMLFSLFGGIFIMRSQDLQPGRIFHSHWMCEARAGNSNEMSPDYLREKILEEDKKKRRRLLFFSCLILFLIVAIITLLALKPNLLQDPSLVNNIDLLSNGEEISFYNKMEFYQWLDLAVAKQEQ